MPSESDSLTVSTTVHGTDRAVVAVSGELDADTVAVLHQQLAALALQGRRHIVLDLALVPFMDSSGMNGILRARTELQHFDGQLLLASPAPAVRRLLDLTGISLASPLHDTTELALASLTTGRGGPSAQAKPAHAEGPPVTPVQQAQTLATPLV